MIFFSFFYFGFWNYLKSSTICYRLFGLFSFPWWYAKGHSVFILRLGKDFMPFQDFDFQYQHKSVWVSNFQGRTFFKMDFRPWLNCSVTIKWSQQWRTCFLLELEDLCRTQMCFIAMLTKAENKLLRDSDPFQNVMGSSIVHGTHFHQVSWPSGQ